MAPKGIYIHIPFCHSKCIYCDFYSTPVRKRIDEVAAGISAEYRYRREELSGCPSTIYFGGGTPSVMHPSLLEHIIKEIDTRCVEEFTIEANPEDITPQTVAEWRNMGINRVSMGIQSLDNDILRWMRRRHDASTALNAITCLQDNGITNISCDLIYGIPRMTLNTWVQTLNRVLSSGITHLSAYCLSYYDNTALSRRYHKNIDPPPPDDDVIAGQFEILRNITAQYGFEHYEISNFSTPGNHSRHNSIYWTHGGEWLGLGPSAHSFDGKTRRIDISDVDRWLSMLPTPYEIESETSIDRINDNIVTSLRTSAGLDLTNLPTNFAERIIADAEMFIKRGCMKLDNNKLSILPQYWLIADSFIRELIQINDC
ncbi:MAG: radical SAM family heme chaperone HemW [Odoribacter sp.]|nr:radical SAM family heme chaperone HemW [Odoribacter sp.]